MPYLIIKIRHRRKGGDGAGNMFCNAAGQFGSCAGVNGKFTHLPKNRGQLFLPLTFTHKFRLCLHPGGMLRVQSLHLKKN